MEILGLLYTRNKQAGLWGTTSSGRGKTRRLLPESLALSPRGEGGILKMTASISMGKKKKEKEDK